MSTTHTSIPDVLFLASIGDPDGTRTVTAIVALLIAIGLALLLLAVWIHRTTRPDPELLAPLEAMGERSWRRGDPVWQRRRLDELRPAGAKPLAPSVAPPKLDLSFDEGPTATGFDDLRTESAQQSGELPVVETAGEGGTDEAADPAESPDATPPALTGPLAEVFPDDEFDEDAVAAAREELEREFAEESGQRQLDLFGRESDV